MYKADECTYALNFELSEVNLELYIVRVATCLPIHAMITGINTCCLPCTGQVRCGLVHSPHLAFTIWMC